MKHDFFSKQSEFYAKYRPTYPSALYDYLIALVKQHNLAWDVATGNGQAAVALSSFFKHVFATDLSEQQLSHAIQRDNITYKQENSELSSLESGSVDLITVATAIHWFDKPKFFAEVDRVLKKDGVLFVWSYGGCNVNAEIDKVIDYFNFEYLFDYWHQGAKDNWVDKYKSLQLPFTLIETPKFTATANYSMYEIMNYMFSWSGVQEYIKQRNENPLKFVEKELLKVWGDPEVKREIKWHLHSKCCRK